jgi:hypothetical protein
MLQLFTQRKIACGGKKGERMLHDLGTIFMKEAIGSQWKIKPK